MNKVIILLVVLVSVSSGCTTGNSSVTNSTPNPVMSLVVSLTDLRKESTVHYNELDLPDTTHENHNERLQWQKETNISLGEAIRFSDKSAQDIVKLCRSMQAFDCNNNPMDLIIPDHGMFTKYEDKFLVSWYQNISDHTNLTYSKSFIAEFSSLDELGTSANSVYSLAGMWRPSGYHPDLELLELSKIRHSSQSRMECIQGTCVFDSILIKDRTIIANHGSNEVGWNRYGGGTTCTIDSDKALLVCIREAYTSTPREIVAAISLE